MRGRIAARKMRFPWGTIRRGFNGCSDERFASQGRNFHPYIKERKKLYEFDG
jgi:hypothetical protein